MKTKRFIDKKQQGQGLVEYALIMVLVAVVVIAVLTVLGPVVGNVFTTINDSFGGGGGGDGGSDNVASSSSSAAPDTSGALAMLCEQDNLPSGAPVNITDPNGYNMQNGTVNLPYGQYNCP